MDDYNLYRPHKVLVYKSLFGVVNEKSDGENFNFG